MAVKEQEHRHAIESATNQANIDTQKRNADLADKHINCTLTSDILGQILGTVVCLCAFGTAIYLVMNGHEIAGAAAFSIPFAGIVKALMNRRAKTE